VALKGVKNFKYLITFISSLGCVVNTIVGFSGKQQALFLSCMNKLKGLSYINQNNNINSMFIKLKRVKKLLKANRSSVKAKTYCDTLNINLLE